MSAAARSESGEVVYERAPRSPDGLNLTIATQPGQCAPGRRPCAGIGHPLQAHPRSGWPVPIRQVRGLDCGQRAMTPKGSAQTSFKVDIGCNLDDAKAGLKSRIRGHFQRIGGVGPDSKVRKRKPQKRANPALARLRM